MKTTVLMLQLSVVSFCLITGFALVGNALAEDAGPSPATAEPAPAALDAGGGTAATEADAPAEAAPEAAQKDPIGALLSLVEAVRGGQWRLVASLALGLLMFGLAKVRDKVKWFSGDRGGAVLVGVLALAGALSTALASDASIDWRLFLGAAGVMWTAVGGYTWIKRLIWPQDA
jgi:hypothetical protein